MEKELSNQEWHIRLFIYQFMVENGRPPTLDETARKFNLTVAEARQAFHRLHRCHQILLEPGSDSIRMAIPLSAVPTDHRVTIDDKQYFANCAFDSLGIPAMLGRDATIEAVLGATREIVRYSIENGSLVAPAGMVIHFPILPTKWFDNLMNT